MKRPRNSGRTLSSPQLKSLRQRREATRRKYCLYLWLVPPPCLFLLYIVCLVDKNSQSVRVPLNNFSDAYDGRVQPPWNDSGDGNVSNVLELVEYTRLSEIDSALVNSPQIESHSLTAVLPVTVESLGNLEDTIHAFLESTTKLHEVVVTCPETILSDTRRIVRRTILAAINADHPQFTIHPWLRGMNQALGALYIAAQVTTEWTLLLDTAGLLGFNVKTRNNLLNPLAITYPVGPRGAILLPVNISCLMPSDKPQAASFLIPPFVAPSTMLSDHNLGSRTSGVWAALGKYTSQTQPDTIGGIVLGYEETISSSWCLVAQHESSSFLGKGLDVTAGPHIPPSIFEKTSSNHRRSRAVPTQEWAPIGVFALIFPSLQELRLFAPVACRLQDSGYIINILLYDADLDVDIPDQHSENAFESGRCRLNYDTPTLNDRPSAADAQFLRGALIFDWLDTLEHQPSVILALAENDAFTPVFALSARTHYQASTWIRIPRADLTHCMWMGSLSIEEWQNWHIPRIDISVITKDRPLSLMRLLSSLSTARYFGDTLTLRINLEQTADEDTLRLVDNLQWVHGSVFVHHRVIHGGLLPAVVESWYPHSNDSYGLILEDDVELSPLFYAWIKMTVLRYRYGRYAPVFPHLFGISLYQQKNVELRPEGRRPFDARALFTSNSLPHRDTPYLSPIPCSWGAVYFPEHWREFHAYLAVRLSEAVPTLGLDNDVVPNVRSNRWSRSWKKFFIELVYLRGYVMLYPNYENFVSLSTNHLEIGAHVKDIPNDVYLRKKELFLLPLMQLDGKDSSSSVALLDLPNRTLPRWDALPVLDLFGSLTTRDMLRNQGLHRRNELTNCSTSPDSPHDVRDLMCMDDHPLILP